MSEGAKAFKSHVHKYLQRIDDYHGLLERWIHAPHPKKKLRELVNQKRISRGQLPVDRRAYVDLQLKPQESLPYDKQLRTIGEIGDLSSFEHGPLAPIHKEIFEHPFHYKGARMVYIPGPKEENMQLAIKLLTDSEAWFTYIIFSDDSCGCIIIDDGLYLFNADVKQADASMHRPLFQYTISALTVDKVTAKIVESAFKQCQKPLRLVCRRHRAKIRVSGSKRRDIYIEIKPKPGEYYLPSGFSGTTLMNNFLQAINFVTAVDELVAYLELHKRFERSLMKDLLQTAFQKAGTVVRVDECEGLEDLQFLKHSWFRKEDGSFGVYVNLGCWLKSWGRIFGFMATGGNLHDKLRGFASEVVRSRDNWGHHELSNAFRAAWLVSDRAHRGLKQLEEEVKRTSILGHEVPFEVLQRRYKFGEAEYREFCSMVASMQIGEKLVHPVVEKIMEKDYGVDPSAQRWSETYPKVVVDWARCGRKRVLAFPKLASP